MSHVLHTPGPEPGGDDLPRLLEGVRAGDEEAARLVVERLYGLVRKIVLANLPRRDEPEDLTQDVFLKMFSRLDQFRGQVPFENWVSRIALTTCLDRLRRQKARPELRWSDLTEEEQQAVAQSADPAEPNDASAMVSSNAGARSLVEKLLAALPPKDAWLLRKVELEEQSLAEVCAATGWMSGAARVRLFRARRRLEAAFRALEGSK
jgi:RNA polymerase sigma-70 factor (ECF subfamily)